MRPVPLLLGIVLLALGFEVTTRLEEWVRYRVPLASRFRDQEDLLIRDADGMHGRANAVYQKWSMNSLGMRGPEVDAVKPPGALRVIATGASETFGLYESPNREFPRQLEDSLASRLGCEAGRVQVLNAAFAGMTLPTIVQDLRNRLRPLGPDVVLLYATPPMYLEARPPEAAVPDSSATATAPPPPIRALYPRGLARLRNQAKELAPDVVLDWFRERQVRSALAGQAQAWRFTEIPEERLASLEADLRAWVGAVRALGAVPVLVTHANAFAAGYREATRQLQWERFHPRATSEVLIAFDSAARLATLRVASDSLVPVADAWQQLSGPGWFADYTHFNDEGAGRVARLAARAVMTGLGSGAVARRCSR